MSPTIQPAPVKTVPESQRAGSRPIPLNRAEASPPSRDDGTSQLLKSGGGTLAVGLLCALLTKTVFGGIGPQGPHTNSGWLALIVTMMCLPFGSLLFLLGALKWLRNRRAIRQH